MQGSLLKFSNEWDRNVSASTSHVLEIFLSSTVLWDGWFFSQ